MTGTARMTPDEDGNCTWNRHWIPSKFRELSQRPGYLTEMPYFTTKEYRLDKGEWFTQPDSSRFAVFTVLCGSVLWDRKTARKGEFILSPAGADAVTAAEAETVLLSTTV